MIDSIIPLILATIGILALRKGEDAYGLMLQGGENGLRLMAKILPSLIVLLSAIAMLRASGAIEFAAGFLSPALKFLGIPSETVMLMLVRPFSGSAALAVGAELITTHGPDSLVGRTAAVMLGSTETTFYTVSVYFGACGIRKSRYALPAALIADAVGFLSASWCVRLLY